MKVKMLKFWRGYQQGVTYDVGPGVADALVNASRAAVYIGPVETMAMEPVETACVQPIRRRGRPMGSKNRPKVPMRFEE